jgi:hypothetical protein
MSDPFHIRRISWRPLKGRGDYRTLHIDIEPTFSERVVPPAGEDYAFNVQHYRSSVEISVSPTGRSVQVFVDGVKVR